jgi:hypothetical protein
LRLLLPGVFRVLDAPQRRYGATVAAVNKLVQIRLIRIIRVRNFVSWLLRVKKVGYRMLDPGCWISLLVSAV